MLVEDFFIFFQNFFDIFFLPSVIKDVRHTYELLNKQAKDEET